MSWALATALVAYRALAGPPLDTLIDPIPHDSLLESMRAGLPALVTEVDDDTGNVLLTLARMWYTASAEAIVSKDVAAAWAMARMPAEHRLALSHARSVYLGEENEAFDRLGDRTTLAAKFLAAAILDESGRRGGPGVGVQGGAGKPVPDPRERQKSR